LVGIAIINQTAIRIMFTVYNLQYHRNRQRYVEMRRTVTAAVRKAKNDWFQQKAKEIEGKVMKGAVGDAWKYIKDIQRKS